MLFPDLIVSSNSICQICSVKFFLTRSVFELIPTYVRFHFDTHGRGNSFR